MRGVMRWMVWLVVALAALLVGCEGTAGDETAAPERTALPAAPRVAATAAATVAPSPTATATMAAPSERRLRYTIDRSALPPLNYPALTLRIFVGAVDEVSVAAEGATDHSYDPESGWVTVTTEASEVEVLLQGAVETDGFGQAALAPLKRGKAWAWSHSMDDNGNLRAAIAVLEQFGWRGTLYLVADWITPEGTDSYLLDEGELRTLLEKGWALGNHTRDHQCDPEQIDRQTVIDGEERLRAIAASSTRPDYRLNSFAAPCMEWSYDPLLREMMAAGQTEALFNEADKRDDGYQNYYRIVVAAEGEVEEDWRTVRFDPALPVGRNFDFESAEEGKGPQMVKAHVDDIAALAGQGAHFWYNTASHGNGEERLLEVATHIYTNYGPGGTDEVWVAPAEEIYSYLLLRELAVVTRSDER